MHKSATLFLCKMTKYFVEEKCQSANVKKNAIYIASEEKGVLFFNLTKTDGPI